ncbi:restriction endonuclease subunit S [Candidatus Haliotispira prima]|uniref:Restriction endonuclease subunit S n=1 Tax=Candidatus Haliotispira prima TaxID=3034016 RepID=A0ABY8MK32_9SPIO|nr:restriction endonuclease subunit S [Candidatus Haliotispira prima]
MPSEWHSSTWGEEISLEYGKSLKGYRESNGTIPVYGSNGAVGWTEKPLTDGPGVILGRKGAYRGVRYSKNPFFVIDTAYYVKPKTELDMQWLYYAIIHHKLGEIDDGSPIPSTTRAAVYVVGVEIPPLPEQKAIAHILGSLDDKIELNRRMNATLEGMAQALFQSWFVDFDPVIDNALAAGKEIPEEFKARAELRRKALADGNANREAAKDFPDSFTETKEMGWIPRGWGVKELRYLSSKISKGTTPRKADMDAALDEPTIPFIKVRDISDNGYLSESGLEVIPRSIHEKKLSRSRLYTGDVLFSIAGTIGRVALVPESLNDSNANQAVAFVRPDAPTPSLYLLEHLRGKFVQDRIHSRIVQAVQANVSLTELGDIPTIQPSFNIVEIWNELMVPNYSRIDQLKIQNQALTNLRDTLLPKLLSGELRVGEGCR